MLEIISLRVELVSIGVSHVQSAASMALSASAGALFSDSMSYKADTSGGHGSGIVGGSARRDGVGSGGVACTISTDVIWGAREGFRGVLDERLLIAEWNNAGLRMALEVAKAGVILVGGGIE